MGTMRFRTKPDDCYDFWGLSAVDGYTGGENNICGWRISDERIRDDSNKKPYLNARTFDFICFRFLQAHTLQT